MIVLLENMGRLALMLSLLACSAFFSGSETAFFNISHSQIQSFRASSGRFQRLAAVILQKQHKLLTTLLLGNMTVNTLFYALASMFSLNVGERFGPAAAAVSAVLGFVVLLLIGEMLPKSIAYSNSKRFCILAAPLCYLFIRLLSPVLAVLEFFVVQPAIRLVIGPVRSVKPSDAVTAIQLKLLIDQSRRQGLISDEETQLLVEAVEFGLLKVRHVMQPRVDMIFGSFNDSQQKLKTRMMENNLMRIPVYHKTIDNVIGILSLRDMLLNPQSAPDKLIRPVHFVPEQKTVESLLEFFRLSHTDTVVVVDEYGGLTGIVYLEKVIEELLGPAMPKERQQQYIRQIGPLEYRLAGNLPVHDWADAFGIDPVQTRLATIGGLAIALLGRIPKEGDVVYLKNLRLTVEKVNKHRIETLSMKLEPLSG